MPNGQALQDAGVLPAPEVSALRLLGLRAGYLLIVMSLGTLAWPGGMDDATWANTAACGLAVIIPFIIPWRHVWARCGRQRAERWR